MAVQFDATGDKLTRTTNLPSTLQSSLTVLGWAKIITDRNDWSTFFNISQGTNDFVYLQTFNDGVKWQIWSQGGSADLFTATAGVWYYLGVQIYLSGSWYARGLKVAVGDSAPAYTLTLSVNNSAPDLLSFGDSCWTNETLFGAIAYCKIWTAVLNDAEIMQEMYVAKPRRTANLFGYYPMMPGARGKDYSGNGYDLTEGGTLTDTDPPPISWGSPVFIFPRAGAATQSITSVTGIATGEAFGTALVTQGIIIDINHETGDTSQYTSTVTDGGNLSVTAAAGLAGTGYGLQAVINDTTVIYGEHNLATPSTTGIVRARFYFDPNSITHASNFYIFQLRNSSDHLVGGVGYLSTGSVQGAIGTDSGTASFTDSYTISDAPHWIELKIVRATTNVSADGYLEFWVDGLLKQTLSNVDNYDYLVNFDIVRAGFLSAASGVSGTFYIDEIIVNDDGSEIGELVSLYPSSISSGEAIGTAVITRGAVNISPNGIATAQAFGTATVTRGAVSVSPSGIATAQAFGTAVVTRGAVTVSPSGIASAQAFGTSILSFTLFMVGIASAQTIGTASILRGAVTVSTSGIATAETFSSGAYMTFYPLEDLFTGADDNSWSSVLWVTEVV